MYNAMNPVAPRPYTANGQGYRREEESEQKTQDSLQQNGGRNQGQGQQGQQNPQQQPRTIATGRASDIANKTVPPRRRNLQPRPTPQGSTTQTNSNPAPRIRTANSNMQQVHPQPVRPQQIPPRPVQQPTQQYHQQPMDKPAVQEPLTPQVYEADAPKPVQEADSRPANATNNKVNIAQILKDFRNTITAIGTPDILREEVEDYLQEVIYEF